MRLIGTIVALALVGCAGGGTTAPTSTDPPTSTTSTDVQAHRPRAPSPVPATPPEPATDAQGGLQDQVRQLFVIHLYGSGGDSATAEQREANRRLYGVETPAEVIRRVRPGGVIYIRRNPQDPTSPQLDTGNLLATEQLAALSADLQQAAREAGLPPLLIATDQENGVITRLPGDGQSFPGGAELGADNDPDRARRIATTTGHALAQVGINVNLAPVADVDTNPDSPVIGDRAFSSDPEVVAGLVRAQVEGYLEAGIAPTLKHFPGHGHADADSHTTLPTVDLPEIEWTTTHLPPFAAGIDAGAPLVMTAHIAAPALDDRTIPATLSKPIITGILREQLGYDGLVVTDSLWMRAARDATTDTDLAVQALQAGTDLLLMPADIKIMVEAIQDAVSAGEITTDQIGRSLDRLDQLRAWLDAPVPPSAAPSTSTDNPGDVAG